MTGSIANVVIADARLALGREVDGLRGRSDLEEVFGAWVSAGAELGLDLRTRVGAAAARSEGARSYRDVALIGFAAASGLREDAIMDALARGIRWLVGREPILNGLPAGFCSDGLALLGVALGAATLGNPDIVAAVADWMEKFILEGCSGRGVDPWERWLFVGATTLVNALPPVVPNDPTTADIRVALRARGIASSLDNAQIERDEWDALHSIRDQTGHTTGVRSAVRLGALDWILRSAPLINPTRPSLDGVANLLRRVPAALRRWTWEDKAKTSGKVSLPRKWEIDHEYHVQNLLWVILSPVFPDMLDEVYLEQFGQLHPRADLCIPSLKLVIEVKFVRANRSFAKTIEEVAADAALYLSKPELYRHILVFVWDDSRRSHEHDLATHGLKQIAGVLDAVIVSRPGNFQSASASSV